MIKMECNKATNGKHIWVHHTDAGWVESGPKPTYFMCEHCHKLIIASELTQLQAIKNQTISTRVLVITTIIAFLALIVSIIGLL
ncbi:MAG TPA: hypothetical protein DHS36_01890 [Candidatus Veblenbacteria bacterium]|uniref:Uncharacterized protein n=2 Tax=Candidatus Vebleniibacteriota TaxID=1817921 RepID=A0A1G2Q436_9BACT|nr:MAG: hypothetical protein UV69_C0003G0002 [Parcubacteria group bacterium GW2011_GWE2_43_12]OHA54789.1 MAG: hypothetical protein A2226_02865 [Candidatus Veblenbacteria bacterium RIFOXYA2_FULL_43_9]OHA56116.1 MAG: hypothetical protein A2441_00170 [Candidatus Veblenbacteria bacterium RIFOXYC2_FULL_42_11]HCX39000.1 hypothetical protein [Candidatus Veblenbacteria bacterium]